MITWLCGMDEVGIRPFLKLSILHGSRGVVANAQDSERARVKVRFSLRAIILSLENLNVIIRAIN